jgi:23S rRNA pseudouridine955/2504/2580 synthase
MSRGRKNLELITGENDKGRRLDNILRKALPDVPLPLIHRLIRKGQVTVNGKQEKAQFRLESGMKIAIPSIKNTENYSASAILKFNITAGSHAEQRLNRQTVKLPSPEILWQDSGLLAVNKPSGLSVHGRASLDETVRCFLAGKLSPSLSFNPGPLHRLDKPSSGIVIFSTSIEGARLFSSLMRERKVRKTYMAIVEGCVKKEEIWQDNLVRDKEKKKTYVSHGNEDGKTAVTKVTPLAANSSYTLIKAEIVTGRTHQIRAQAASRGHPLAGDIKYRGRKIISKQEIKKKVQTGGFYLHALKLEFLEYSIEAPLPGYFRKKIKELFVNFSF